MAWTVAVLCEYCLDKLATIFSLFFIRSNANPINFYSWPVSYSYYGESPLMIDGHVPVQPIIIIARWLYSSWTTLLPMVVDGIRTRSWARIKYWFGTCLFDRWWLGNVTAQNRSTTTFESVGRDLYLATWQKLWLQGDFIEMRMTTKRHRPPQCNFILYGF